MSWKFDQLICLHRMWNIQNKIQIKKLLFDVFASMFFQTRTFLSLLILFSSLLLLLKNGTISDLRQSIGDIFFSWTGSKMVWYVPPTPPSKNPVGSALFFCLCFSFFYLPFPVPFWLFHQNFKKNIFEAFITMALFPWLVTCPINGWLPSLG